MTRKKNYPVLGELVVPAKVVIPGMSDGSARPIVVILAGSVALVMTGFGIIMPIIPKRLEDFGSGVEALALIAMSFALAQLLTGPFIGSVSDKIGRRPIIVLSLASFIATNIGLIFARSTRNFLVIRALEGGLTAGLLPSALGVVGDIAPEGRRGKSVGIVMGSMGAGFIFGPVIGGFLFEWFGYESSFVASAIMGLLALMAVLTMLPESRTSQLRLRSNLHAKREMQHIPLGKKRILISLPRPLMVFGTLLLIDFLLAFTWGFVEPRMVFYFYDDLGWTPIYFGIVVGAYGVALTIGQATLGKLSDIVEKRLIITIGILLFVTFFFVLWFVTSFALILVSALVSGIGYALVEPAVSALYLDIASAQFRSRVMGFKESAGALGLVLGPLLVSGVATFMSAKAIFASAGFLAFLGATVAYTLLTDANLMKGTDGVSGKRIHSQRQMLTQTVLRRLMVMAVAARQKEQ